MDNFKLITRKEVMMKLGYKTIRGFEQFLSKNPNFPPKIKRVNTYNAMIFFDSAAVDAFITTRLQG